ncbi:DUF2975 domain-containing protein [Rickettsia endosymbiont of Halotydeus destructor]|uniref:DUF2975 domain-containing protein n=1 Tax=Rickettsia endosymbiont of Halotydeus destructor TaxID=2996754 RepID=UPI003BAE917F
MNKIQKVSYCVSWLLNSLIITIPGFLLLSWIFIDSEIMKNLTNRGIVAISYSHDGSYTNLSLIKWTISSKFLGFVAYIFGVLPLLFNLYYLKKIFINYSVDEIFNVLNAKYYNNIAWIFFLSAILIEPLSNTLLTFAVTTSNPVGQRYISLSFGTTNLQNIFFGILVIVISWVMLEASKIQTEYKFTI